jgi:hypothetical protein
MKIALKYLLSFCCRYIHTYIETVIILFIIRKKADVAFIGIVWNICIYMYVFPTGISRIAVASQLWWHVATHLHGRGSNSKIMFTRCMYVLETAAARVTRFFWLFGSFLKIAEAAHILGTCFSDGIKDLFISTKKGWATFWTFFKKNSSGHPDNSRSNHDIGTYMQWQSEFCIVWKSCVFKNKNDIIFYQYNLNVDETTKIIFVLNEKYN